MYGLEWIERLRWRAGRPADEFRYRASPVVWALGLTSFLTDISSEMVSSLLPLYLVLHLHLSPLQFGAIDGVYNGFATLLVAMFAGWYADRANRRKEVAAGGYGLSALCKLLLIAAGSAWSSILFVVGLDRLGKGLRAAPRDALISLHTPRQYLASAFGLHRALDAAGALLGPLAAFLLIAWYPARFELVWLVSFVFAALGVAAILLLVPGRPRLAGSGDPAQAPPAASGQSVRWINRRFTTLLTCAAVLAVTTISDNFIYLLLQKQFATNASYLPLFPVVTAGSYMLLAVPVARLADRTRHVYVLLGGYAVLVLLYGLLLVVPGPVAAILPLSLVMLGTYYAATEGVLVALASRELPEGNRTAGIAMLVTVIGAARMISSLLFGWAWGNWSEHIAVLIFLVAMVVGGGAVARLLGKWHD